MFKKYPKNRKGFTLLELLTVMSIIGILTAVSIPSYHIIKRNVTLNNSAKELVSNLRTAQRQSLSSQDGVKWGIRFENNQYILIWCDDTSCYDDTVHSLANDIEIIQGAGTEIEFTRLTGTTTDQDIIIGFSGGKQKTITIEQVGKISLKN